MKRRLHITEKNKLDQWRANLRKIGRNQRLIKMIKYSEKLK